jgi:SAM-dependent methyltransferase
MTTQTTTGTTDRDLAQRWERWWAEVGQTPGEVLWEADPGDLDADLGHFVGSFGKALPVIDLGCGDGRQTRFLAKHFLHVVGVDVSAAAIGRARTADNPPNVSFHLLDARDSSSAATLHAALGDANVYIRGVLQALPPASRPDAVEVIATLLGTTGTLFAKELPPEVAAYFADVVKRYGGPPPSLAKVMQHIQPGQITLEALAGLFPIGRFNVLGTGDSRIRTVNTLPGGEVIIYPAIWALIRPRNARESA